MFPSPPANTMQHVKARCSCGHWVGVSGPKGSFRIMADRPCPGCHPQEGWSPVEFNPELTRPVAVEVRWSDGEHVDPVLDPLWVRLRVALEGIVRDAFELPQDEPSLDHAGWRPILDLIAEATGGGKDAAAILGQLRPQSTRVGSGLG